MAAKCTDYGQYLGIDISETCVDLCSRMVEQRMKTDKKKIEVRCQDFFAYDGPSCDAVILGEVLEHVERPERFLAKLYEVAAPDAFIYVATVVNCPQKDHIYLFRSVEEIESLYRQEGFRIVDRLLVPTNRYSLEKAVKKKAAINTAHILKKEGAGK